MIRVNKFVDFLVEHTGIEREFFFIDIVSSQEQDLEAFSTTVAPNGNDVLIKKYDSQIVISSVDKKRQFTPIAIYVRDFFRKFGHIAESFSIRTQDLGEELFTDIEIECSFLEETELILLEGQELEETSFDDIQIIYGKSFREIEYIEEKLPGL